MSIVQAPPINMFHAAFMSEYRRLRAMPAWYDRFIRMPRIPPDLAHLRLGTIRSWPAEINWISETPSSEVLRHVGECAWSLANNDAAVLYAMLYGRDHELRGNSSICVDGLKLTRPAKWQADRTSKVEIEKGRQLVGGYENVMAGTGDKPSNIIDDWWEARKRFMHFCDPNGQPIYFGGDNEMKFTLAFPIEWEQAALTAFSGGAYPPKRLAPQRDGSAVYEVSSKFAPSFNVVFWRSLHRAQNDWFMFVEPSLGMDAGDAQAVLLRFGDDDPRLTLDATLPPDARLPRREALSWELSRGYAAMNWAAVVKIDGIASDGMKEHNRK